MDLKGKVAIITGARRGMGKAHALKLAAAGARVVVSDVSLPDCQEVAREIRKNKGEAMAVKCDVTRKKEVDNMVRRTVERWGKIDILVNNAGIALGAPILEVTEADWDRVLDINLKGSFLCAQAVAREMVKQKSGSIINVASAGMGQIGLGFANSVHYCASKGGVVAMTQAFAGGLAPYNIRVNAIAPGLIETQLGAGWQRDPEGRKRSLSRVPLARVGQPEEVANLVLFLASDENSYMTGSTVVIDGGWLAV